MSSVNSSPVAVESQELKSIEQTGLEENITNKIIKIFPSKNLKHQLFLEIVISSISQSAFDCSTIVSKSKQEVPLTDSSTFCSC